MALRPCLQPGCSELVENGRCRKHSKAREKEFRNPKLRNLYKSQRWKKKRLAFLVQNPLCACGCGSLAEVVDHIIPIDGTSATPSFWDQSNWQGLTRNCHNKKTRKDLEERTW